MTRRALQPFVSPALCSGLPRRRRGSAVLVPARARGASRATAVALALTLASTASATVPSDLCTGNPCIVSGTKTVTAGSALDFGAGTDLRFAGNAVVKLGTDGSRFQARSITFEPGARMEEGGDTCHRLDLVTTGGDMVMQSAGALHSRIVSNGPCPIQLEVVADGNVTLASLELLGEGFYGFGGSMGITATGSIATTAKFKISTDSDLGIGGQIYMSAGTGITIGGPIDQTAPYEGGSFDVDTAAGDIVINGKIDASGGYEGAGSIQMDAYTGSIAINADITGLGKTYNPGYYLVCGHGSYVSLGAAQNVTLAGKINIGASGGSGCSGGNFYAEVGGDFAQTLEADFSSVASGAYASGGSFDLAVSGDVTLGDVNVGTGFINVYDGADAVVAAGNLRGSSTYLSGCDVLVAPKAKLAMIGDPSFGSNAIYAGETLTIAGSLLAFTENVLRTRDGAPLVSGSILPAPSIGNLASIPDCRPGPACTPGGSCGDGAVHCGEQCDEGAANGTPASRCTSACVELPPALRIPGGGVAARDCPFEWSAELGSVTLDGSGLPSKKQRCTDNDPSCDFEPAPGRCKLRLWGCAGGADAALGCAATAVSSVIAQNPRLTSRNPSEVAARQALDAALAAFAGGAGPGEVCAPRFDVDVIAGPKAMKLKVKATPASGTADSDQLELTCAP